MTGAATRWRLIELQRRRRAIDSGVDLLDRKREGLSRALTQRARQSAGRRARLATALAAVSRLRDRATAEISEAAALAAALAQPRSVDLCLTSDVVVGVRVVRIAAGPEAAALHYGQGGTCAALDETVRAYVALLPEIIRLAEEEAAERSLKRGLKRTTRTLNALRTVLLPAVDADIRAVTSGLEEEEREEAIRWRTGRS